MADGTLFDADYYRNANPDVVAVFGSSDAAMYQHYKEYGQKEGRPAYSGLDIKNTPVSLSLFPRIGVIGDSFASGAINKNGKITDTYYVSWPQVMGKRYGVTVTNYTRGGLYTGNWLTVPEGLSKLNRTQADDLYMLVLGNNDCYGVGFGEAYLGTIKDIKGKTDMSQYANSFYGNYGRIIELIRAHAPKAKLVMVTMAFADPQGMKYNRAIEEIAKYYGIPYIRQYTDPFFLTDTYQNMDLGHPTTEAYSGMADAFARLLTENVEKNRYYYLSR